MFVCEPTCMMIFNALPCCSPSASLRFSQRTLCQCAFNTLSVIHLFDSLASIPEASPLSSDITVQFHDLSQVSPSVSDAVFSTLRWEEIVSNELLCLQQFHTCKELIQNGIWPIVSVPTLRAITLVIVVIADFDLSVKPLWTLSSLKIPLVLQVIQILTVICCIKHNR